MISRKKLNQRVSARKQHIAAERSKLERITGKLSEFIADIKERSVIYNLIRILPLWKELEELIADLKVDLPKTLYNV